MNKARLIIIFVSVLFLASCTDSKDKMVTSIQDLEQNAELNADQLKELAESYSSFIEKYPEDSLCRSYAFKTCEIYEQLEDNDKLLQHISIFQEKFPDTYESNILIYKKSKALHAKGDIGDAILEMKKFNELKSKLSSEEMTFFGVLYLDYTTKYPNDGLSPKYSLELANVMSSLGNKEGAYEEFKEFYVKYPKSNGAPYAMMQAADISDKHLNMPDTAKSILQNLAKTYPDHAFGQEAKLILDNGYVGKTNAEVLKDILEKQKK